MDAPTIKARLAKLEALFQSHEPDVWSSFFLNHNDALEMLIDPNSQARQESNRAAHDIISRKWYESVIAEVINKKNKAAYQTLLNILIPMM